MIRNDDRKLISCNHTGNRTAKYNIFALTLDALPLTIIISTSGENKELT